MLPLTRWINEGTELITGTHRREDSAPYLTFSGSETFKHVVVIIIVQRKNLLWHLEGGLTIL